MSHQYMKAVINTLWFFLCIFLKKENLYQLNIYFGIECHHNNPWRIDVCWRVSMCHSGAGLGKIHLKNTNLYCTNVVNNLGYLCELKIYFGIGYIMPTLGG